MIDVVFPLTQMDRANAATSLLGWAVDLERRVKLVWYNARFCELETHGVSGLEGALDIVVVVEVALSVALGMALVSVQPNVSVYEVDVQVERFERKLGVDICSVERGFQRVEICVDVFPQLVLVRGFFGNIDTQ